MNFSTESKHWYWLVMLVLLVGYAISGIGPVAIYYFGFLGNELPEAFLPILYSFLIGMLGATVQLSIHFSRDVNAVMSKAQSVLPTCFEFFGYVLKMLWGGIAAVFFVLSLKLGFFAAVSGSAEDLRMPAVVLISFCAGLRAYRILIALAGIVPTKST